MSEIELGLSIVTALTSIITATVLIFTYYQDKRRDEPQFDLSALWGSSSPQDTNRRPIGIQIQNPTKPIDCCQVFHNGTPLETQFGVHFIKSIYVHAGGSALFELPKNLVNFQNDLIVVKDGKKKLKEIKLGDLPHAF